MKHLKTLVPASALALAAACVVVGPAAATAIDPAGTAITLNATNSVMAISGGSSVACTSSTLSGTTPAAGAVTTWKTIVNTTLTYGGCTAFSFFNALVAPNAACHTPATALELHAMGVNAASAIGTVTLLSGCSIDVWVPVTGCALTIAGPQAIGNGTAGAGGIQWTNAAPNIVHFSSATVASVVSNGVGFVCPTAGAHTGTLTANYTRTSSTNVTVTP